MTFQQLYYLLEVEKTGSFSIAAKNVFVTQSTMSNAVASLEKEIGRPIFTRGKKALSLTPVGEEIIAHAKRICESHKYITTGEKTHDPMLRIGSPRFAPARSAFVRLVEENRDNPNVQFVYHDGRNKNFSEELLAYRMDVAVAMYTTPSVAKNEENFRKKGFHYEKLITLPGAVCIGPGHRLYDVPDFSLEELKNDRFIELPSRPASRKESIKTFLPLDETKSLGTTHSDVRKELLRRGLGYTLTYIHSAEERAASELRYVPVPGLEYNFYVFYDRFRPMTPEIFRFLELLKEAVAGYTI